jgi:hypothetical protein
VKLSLLSKHPNVRAKEDDAGALLGIRETTPIEVESRGSH